MRLFHLSDVRLFDLGFSRGIAAANKKARQSTDKTPAAYANAVKQNLGDLFVTIKGGVGMPFLTEDESKAAHASIQPDKHERYLVAYMTPIFQEKLMTVFPDHYVLVNSEEYPWLPQSANFKINYLAPDQLIAPHYLVNFRTPYKNAPAIADGEYGTFPVINAKKSIVAICDAKKVLNSTGEGDFMKLLECLTYPEDCYSFIVVRGFVYDWQSCMLMTAINGSISQITAVKWTTDGSYDLIRNYFKDYEKDWDNALTSACQVLNVSLPHFSSTMVPTGGSSSCILGAGAFGRVFKVIRNIQGENQDEIPQQFALKLVIGENCRELDNEYEVAMGLTSVSSIQDFIIRPIAGSLRKDVCGTNNLPMSAFLMDSIGEPFHHHDDITDGIGRLILESLSNLHAANVSHNDARYKNVVSIKVNGSQKLRWIDLGRCSFGSAVKFEKDIVTFFQSVEQVFDEKAVRQYAEKTFRNEWRDAAERHRAVRSLWTTNA